MPAYTSEAKLRFYHMDRAGMVFHGAYAAFFQDAFEDFMEHVGFVEKELEPELDVRVPVVRHLMTFPAAPEGDALTIQVSLASIGRSSATFELTARDRRDEVVAEAEVVRVCIGLEGKPVEIPAPLRKAWEPYLGD